MYKLIIFDMDGTIADTDKVIVKSYLELYKIYKPNDIASVDKIRTFSGPPINKTLTEEFPHLELDFIKKEYRRISKGNYIKYSFPCMPRGVCIHNRIIIAIRIQVQSMSAFRVEIIHRIRRDKSANFRVLISRLQVITICFLIGDEFL